MVVFPNAKINIGLHITGKRNDGYHRIESCFYPVKWSDILEVAESRSLSFESSGIPIPGPREENLCLKAYELLRKLYRIPPVSFHLHKIIPIGAGLGGGSSDGAFALKALNKLFDLQLDFDSLEKLALQIGSDCPFFIRNKLSLVSGRGEVFEDLDFSLKGKYIVLVNPPIHISTAEAYGSISRYAEDGILKGFLEKMPLEQWKNKIINSFEEPLFKKYPMIASLKKLLYDKGALFASMTGSGATVFGIFKENMPAKDWFPEECIVWLGEA